MGKAGKIEVCINGKIGVNEEEYMTSSGVLNWLNISVI